MTAAAPAIDLAPLRNAFSQLSEALMLWEAEPQVSVLKRHLRAAAIQSFEFTYELSLRMMRRVLIERSLAADLVQDLSFKTCCVPVRMQACWRTNRHGGAGGSYVMPPAIPTMSRKHRKWWNR